MKRIFSRPAWALLTGLALGAGCHVGVVINSEPTGARVVVDGVEGVTPFTAYLGRTTFGRYPVLIERDGYEIYEGELETDPDAGAILISLLFPPAWLFDWNRPVALTTVELKPLEPFPQAFAHEEPWTPILPPLPPGMEGPPTRPASRPSTP